MGHCRPRVWTTSPHGMSIATMPVANTVFPNICCTGCLADVKKSSTMGVPNVAMWSIGGNFSTRKCFKWGCRFTSNQSDMSRLPRSYIPTRPYCNALNSRNVGWNVLGFLFASIHLKTSRRSTPAWWMARGAGRDASLAASDGASSLLPHWAFQSVNDRCPQYRANALSVDWLYPPPDCTRPKNRFSVDTLTPKRESNKSSSRFSTSQSRPDVTSNPAASLTEAASRRMSESWVLTCLAMLSIGKYTRPVGHATSTKKP